MYAVSAHFLTALRDAHTIALRAILYPPGAAAFEVRLLEGSVTVDIDADVKRRAEVEIAFSLEEVSAETLRILPFGGYATLERGIRFGDGSVELVPLGYFRIEHVTWPELQGRATLSLATRMAQVNDEAFTVPYQVSGLKPSDAIEQMIFDVFGSSIGYDIQTDPATEAALVDVVYDEDRGAATRDLCASIGAWQYFDTSGDFVLAPLPDGGGPPVWTIDTGERGVLLDCNESLDRSNVRNGVAVRAVADSALPPIYALATDDDPSSPTLWGGPFGKVPLIVTSNSIATQAQADSTAAALLNLRLGLSRTLELFTVPNPALAGSDLIEIVHADGRSETALVNAFELPLGPAGQMRIFTRTNWRPTFEAGARRRARRPLRFYRGLEAVRELEGAA